MTRADRPHPTFTAFDLREDIREIEGALARLDADFSSLMAEPEGLLSMATRDRIMWEALAVMLASRGWTPVAVFAVVAALDPPPRPTDDPLSDAAEVDADEQHAPRKKRGGR